ncbi:MAG TPA: hypothetical protein VNN73_19005 [Blastocatellia bacterium]|nr:hypothetical protein [Blastocatellia bacterium]
MKITITTFRPKVIDLLGTSPEGGKGQLELQIENTSGEFALFKPQRFSFLSRDNKQVDILDKRHRFKEYLPAVEIEIAPGAHIKEFYRLNGGIELPARLFYNSKLLAVITD